MTKQGFVILTEDNRYVKQTGLDGFKTSKHLKENYIYGKGKRYKAEREKEEIESRSELENLKVAQITIQITELDES